MFDSLWKNINIATMAGPSGYGIINNAALAITGGKFSWVGPATEMKKAPEDLSDYVYDGEGRWVTPGLIDCHTHLAYAGNRAVEFEQRLKGVSYEDIARAGGGIAATVAATRAAAEEDIFELTLARMRQLFREGVTTFEIKSGYGLDLENERKLLRVATQLRDELGFRIQRTFLGAHAIPPEYKGQQGAYVDHVCNDMLPVLYKEGLIDAVDAFCDNIGFTAAETEKIFSAAKNLGIPLKLHAEQLSNQNGAALAARYKALSADHLEYADEAGVRAMAESGMTAVLLPGAFYFLREKQLPPIDLFRRYGVPMAVATDHNPGTSPTLSLLLMMNMAATLFRLTPEEALRGTTQAAARALGLLDVCGTIETGKAADFALWDISHPHELVYAFGANPCRAVVMGGDDHVFAEE